jgi:hypothetical protein
LSGITAVGDNNNFTPEQNKRWDELEAAEERHQNRQNSDRAQQQQLSGNDEQRFACLFADANRKIDELESVARQKKSNIDTELEKSKREVVQGLASTLKDSGFPVNRIANEIVHQLKGRASKSWILEILDDEYKDKAHQRKRKVGPVADQNQQVGVSHGDETVGPVADQNQQVMVGVGGHEIIGSGDLPSEQGSGDLPSEQDSGDLPMNKTPEIYQCIHQVNKRKKVAPEHQVNKA